MLNVLEGGLPEQKREEKKSLHQSDILPGTIKPRHIASNHNLIETGTIANRPDGNTRVAFYLATDENKLYYYNKISSSWVSVTLS